MKYMIPLLLTGSLFLAACTPTAPTAQHGGGNGGHIQGSSASTLNLLVDDQSTDDEIAFSVQGEDGVFTDYGVSHTKEMHLIVVRDDLQHFQHLHPERDADGVWRVAFSPPAGGTYWRYADFVEKDGTPHVIRFKKTVTGAAGNSGLVRDEKMTKEIQGVTFTLDPVVLEGKRLELRFAATINDKPVTFGSYLGEKGHVILLSQDGEYIHTHPHKEYVGYSESDAPIFLTPQLTKNFYRIFGQFKVNGEILTIDFDWQS